MEQSIGVVTRYRRTVVSNGSGAALLFVDTLAAPTTRIEPDNSGDALRYLPADDSDNDVQYGWMTGAGPETIDRQLRR